MRFTKKTGIWTDIHLRTKENFFTNFSQSLFRVGLTYYLDDHAKLTTGYAFVNHYPDNSHPRNTQPEHRIWQQAQWHSQYPSLRLMQWIRLEERFRSNKNDENVLATGYRFNFRVRYNILSQFPLTAKKFQPGTLSLVLSDELFVNFGKEIVNNYFDQNRFFCGFHYHLNKHDLIQIGYMNIFQQMPAGNSYKSMHVARLFYFHNMDLRTGKKK